jgi:hypothetical protein
MATRLNGRGEPIAGEAVRPMRASRSRPHASMRTPRAAFAPVTDPGRGGEISGGPAPETVAMLNFLRAQVIEVGGVD